MVNYPNSGNSKARVQTIVIQYSTDFAYAWFIAYKLV